MKYRVLWAPFAEQRIEEILRGAAARLQELAAAAQEIDQQLFADPCVSASLATMPCEWDSCYR